MVYGYCRVSTAKQKLERQKENIKRYNPEALIYEDKFSGKTDSRPAFVKLIKKVKSGDTIIFDEVSRMSRNAREGFEDYMKLYNRGINLVFLKEPQINTDVYRESQQQSIELTGNEIADVYIEATNKLFMLLAERQIKAAFEHAEKERYLLSQRTKEGIIKSNKPSGRTKGVEQHQKKERAAKKIIAKNHKEFGGTLRTSEVIKLAGISAPTFYKYFNEIKENAADRQMDITDY